MGVVAPIQPKCLLLTTAYSASLVPLWGGIYQISPRREGHNYGRAKPVTATSATAMWATKYRSEDKHAAHLPSRVHVLGVVCN